MFQDVSISVSVLTLVAISIDRYYAICHPLKFKSNLNQAKRIIVLIWLISLLIMAPDLIYLSARASQDLTEAGLDTVLYSDCNYNWSEHSSKVFQFIKTILLYLLPFILMFCAHFKIMRTLQMASSTEQKHLELQESYQQQHYHQKIAIFIQESAADTTEKNTKSEQLIGTTTNNVSINNSASVEGCDLTTAPLQLTTLAPADNNQYLYQNNNQISIHNNSTLQPQDDLKVTMHNKTKLESRRKAANMLIAIVIFFGVCYLPVHLINFLR